MAGESYAGKYLSWLGSTIVNKTNPAVKLGGIMFGNAWIYPLIQTQSYGTYLHDSMLLAFEDMQNGSSMIEEYKQYVIAENWNMSIALEEKILEYFLMMSNVTNIYNFRYSYELSDINSQHMVEYLNKREVQQALHVQDPIKYEECDNTNGVFEALLEDLEQDASYLLPHLSLQIPLLFYVSVFPFSFFSLIFH